MDSAYETLIDTTSDFVREMMNYYGDEAGLEMVREILPKVNQQLADDVLIKALTGELTGRFITLQSFRDINPPFPGGTPSGLIQGIKLIRELTGYGLKEAKDTVDGLRSPSPRPVRITLFKDGVPRSNKIARLRATGFVI